MAPLLTPEFVALDVVCCMGIGFFVALMRSFVPSVGAVFSFSTDFCAVLFALLLAQGYAVQSSSAGVLRLYMVVGVLCGALGFTYALAPHILFLLNIIQCVLVFPMRFLLHALIKPLVCWLKERIRRYKEVKISQRAKKTRQKQLQIARSLLYNSNI